MLLLKNILLNALYFYSDIHLMLYIMVIQSIYQHQYYLKLIQNLVFFFYFFLGVFTLPLIESEWPESIKRKYVQFDLEDILVKSTN